MRDRDQPPPDYARAGRCTAIVIGDDGACGAALAAIELVGGRVLAQIAWVDVAQRLAASAGTPVLLVEAEGVGEELLAAALPRIDAVAATLDLSVVIAFALPQLDVVAAHLLGRNVQLLCAPSMADRVAALAVASELAGPPVLNDTWRESEATRLQRLNEEVARIAEVLARLTRSEPAGDVEDRRGSFAAEPATVDPVDPLEIRRAIRTRRLRDQFFGGGLFEDSAWDMLLDLYAAELEDVRVSVSSLCIAAAVAPTTALRWISKKTEAGLFDPEDRRRAFMALTGPASDAMRSYVAAAKRADLTIA